MTVYKRSGSPYYMTSFTVEGLRVRESTKELTKQMAEKYEEMLRHKIRQQLVYGEKPQKTWKDATDRWISEMGHKRTIRQDQNYIDWLSNNSLLINLKLVDINKDQIESVIALKKDLTNSSKNRILQLIKSILNRAYKHWEWLDKVPHIQLYRENDSRIRYLTKPEVIRLLKELPEHLRDMAEFTLNTGLRASNVKDLQWSELNIEANRLIIPASKFKSNKLLVIPLNKRALEIIFKQRNKHSKAVFTYEGRPIGQCNTKAFRQALIRAGIKDFRWHDLRHTFASHLVQAGVSLNIVQQLLGHASSSMTQKYAHLAPVQLLDSVNILCEV